MLDRRTITAGYVAFTNLSKNSSKFWVEVGSFVPATGIPRFSNLSANLNGKVGVVRFWVGPHHLVDAQRTAFRSRTTGFLGIDVSCSGLVRGRPFFLGIGKGGGGTLYVNSSFILQI